MASAVSRIVRQPLIGRLRGCAVPAPGADREQPDQRCPPPQISTVFAVKCRRVPARRRRARVSLGAARSAAVLRPTCTKAHVPP
jgi:hypothetical protein